MNKLFGFLELKELPVPSVNWKEFKYGTVLDSDKLWTVRSAVVSGNDTSLPRMIGKSAEECMNFGNSLVKNYGKNMMVVYYPFFHAIKSGTMLVSDIDAIIECVRGDLWNLVDRHKIDHRFKLSVSGRVVNYTDNVNFLTKEEVQLLHKNLERIRKYFSKSLRANELVLLEWSFAKDCNAEGNPVGDSKLLFYEVRTVSKNKAYDLF